MTEKIPTGYIAWHEWAEAQRKAGHKQTQCPKCKRWLFHQEKRVHQCAETPTSKEKPHAVQE